MNTLYKSLMGVLAAGVLAVGCGSTALTSRNREATTEAESTPGVKSSEEVQFICREGYDLRLDKKVPITYAWTSRGKSTVIRWVRNDFQQYDPWRRCREVSPRFQTAYKNGSFKYLTNGIWQETNQPVICTAREEGGDCDTLLFTLLHTDDGLEILADLKAILRGRNVDGPPGGGIYQDSQVYIEVDIDEFLRTAPVEEKP